MSNRNLHVCYVFFSETSLTVSGSAGYLQQNDKEVYPDRSGWLMKFKVFSSAIGLVAGCVACPVFAFVYGNPDAITYFYIHCSSEEPILLMKANSMVRGV